MRRGKRERECLKRECLKREVLGGGLDLVVGVTGSGARSVGVRVENFFLVDIVGEIGSGEAFEGEREENFLFVDVVGGMGSVGMCEGEREENFMNCEWRFGRRIVDFCGQSEAKQSENRGLGVGSGAGGTVLHKGGKVIKGMLRLDTPVPFITGTCYSKLE